MRQLEFIATYDHELVVDGFAGGGGASTGIERALGRSPDIAINHSPTALAMHEANHPHTRHYCESIFEVDPVEVCAGRPVGLAWFSPDCTHFSRAKGSKPVDKKIRGLAWVVVDWAKKVRPRTILLENVEEFQTWGPLDADGYPDKAHAGDTFREWLGALTALGYTIDYRVLCAADHGAPTTRKRLFLVAQRDSARPVIWPDATHGKGCGKAWRTAAEIIEWTLPTTSIFGRPRPLAEATLARIARGIERFVLDTKVDPFLIPLTHQGDTRTYSVDEPLRTVTAANRGEFSLVAPFIVRHGHYSTITGAGLREGCGAGLFRGQPLSLPLATVCATNDKHLVAPIITKHFGGVTGHRVDDRPLGTVTARDHHALTAAFLVKYYGQGTGQPLGEPLHTVTAKARFGLVTLRGEEYRIGDIGTRMLHPRELFAAQGFPSSYILDPVHNGKRLGVTEQTKLAGNSVCPDVAAALVAANVLGEHRRAA